MVKIRVILPKIKVKITLYCCLSALPSSENKTIGTAEIVIERRTKWQWFRANTSFPCRVTTVYLKQYKIKPVIFNT